MSEVVILNVVPKQRYTFTKEERLKSRKTIEQLFAQGKSFSIFPFRVIWKWEESAGTGLQAGFTAGSKHFKKAVDRNRIRRLMREAYRLQKTELRDQLKKQQKSLSVFFIYSGNELPQYQLAFDKMGAALTRLIKIVHENDLADT
ncbi:MAG TPA: ribonuclease P protein component [Ferruginibacter sp.]|nr:ribonuclease P protein component [Ferruginibacter sp.]